MTKAVSDTYSTIKLYYRFLKLTYYALLLLIHLWQDKLKTLFCNHSVKFPTIVMKGELINLMAKVHLFYNYQYRIYKFSFNFPPKLHLDMEKWSRSI